MTSHYGHWELGTAIGIPVLIVITIIIALFAWKSYRLPYRDNYKDMSYWGIGRWVFSILLVILLIGAPLGSFPWSMQYHRYQYKTGTVVDVSSRILGGDSASPSQKFVVRFGPNEEFGCNDTRCALIKVGDIVELSCLRIWQYNGTDGWDCDFVADSSGAT